MPGNGLSPKPSSSLLFFAGNETIAGLGTRTIIGLGDMICSSSEDSLAGQTYDVLTSQTHTLRESGPVSYSQILACNWQLTRVSCQRGSGYRPRETRLRETKSGL